MGLAVESVDLVKAYGPHRALDGVGVQVPDGGVYGLVGANGAGKTTLFGLVCGLRGVTRGVLRVLGGPPAAAVRAGQVRYLADTPQFYPWLSGREMVRFALAVHRVDDGPAAADALLDRVGLLAASGRKTRGYSRGMLQRLGLATVLAGEPRLLVLDEPSAALDPEGRAEVLDIVREAGRTATVIFSTHVLADAQRVCTTVGILRAGRLLVQAPLADLLAGEGAPTYFLDLPASVPGLAARLGALPFVGSVRESPPVPGGTRVRVLVQARDHDAAVTLLPRMALDAGGALEGFGRLEATLEDVFLALTAGTP